METVHAVTVQNFLSRPVLTFLHWSLPALLAAIQLKQSTGDSLGPQQGPCSQAPLPHNLTCCLVSLHTVHLMEWMSAGAANLEAHS